MDFRAPLNIDKFPPLIIAQLFFFFSSVAIIDQTKLRLMQATANEI